MDVQQWYVESALREIDRQYPDAGAWALVAMRGAVRHQSVLRRTMHVRGGWLIVAGGRLRRAAELPDNANSRIAPPSVGGWTR